MTGKEIEQFEDALKNSHFYIEHHKAMEIGYLRQSCGYIERYAGRFGNGFKLHYPNSFRSLGNRFHTVVYLVENPKRK